MSAVAVSVAGVRVVAATPGGAALQVPAGGAWQPVATMPAGVDIEVRSATGLIRRARRMAYSPVRRARPGWPERVTVRRVGGVSGGDVAAVAWRWPS
jgi:hypothetical protein